MTYHIYFLLGKAGLLTKRRFTKMSEEKEVVTAEEIENKADAIMGTIMHNDFRIPFTCLVTKMYTTF